MKLSDFGVSVAIPSDGGVVHCAVGSTPYMSPERIRGEGYGTPADVWAIGLTLAVCTCVFLLDRACVHIHDSRFAFVLSNSSWYTSY